MFRQLTKDEQPRDRRTILIRAVLIALGVALFSSNELLTESVRAFQKLWNRNNPNDLIDEDGVFGDIQTGPRLLLSPIEGFGNVT